MFEIMTPHADDVEELTLDAIKRSSLMFKLPNKCPKCAGGNIAYNLKAYIQFNVKTEKVECATAVSIDVKEEIPDLICHDCQDMFHPRYARLGVIYK